MPLPRFVQRLFQNDGYGPKLRSEIIPWDDEKRFTALEAWRQAMIGTPMPMASTTLPAGFMWADGSFASFAAYPELKAKYDAGGFAGMLLAYDAQEADISAYPGKFKPDSANPTGLFVPRLNGLFARYCGGNGAGSYNKPGLPNIKGRFDVALNRLNDPVSYLGQTSAGTGEWGAFYVEAGATGGPLGSLTTNYPKGGKEIPFSMRPAHRLFMAHRLWLCQPRRKLLLRYTWAGLPRYRAVGNETFSGRVLSAVRWPNAHSTPNP